MIREWLDGGQEMQALYYASLDLKIEADRKEAEKVKRKASGGKRKR